MLHKEQGGYSEVKKYYFEMSDSAWEKKHAL